MLTAPVPVALPKARTGIPGLDELTEGGLPHGRPTLVCGTAGCGKTMLGLQFLVRGALDFDEPGVFVAFEESAEDLAANVASLDWDLAGLEQAGHLIVEHIALQPNQIQEAGLYDLEGLFIRLGAAIDSIGAKRVVIDTLEVLFASLSDQSVVRSELRRLFRWLKERNVTAIVTAESGDSGSLTRHGLEEYVSDCVIFLDHRVSNQISTRRMRIIKYRGSSHGTDETPFMIDEHGFRVMPVRAMRLAHEAPEERVSTGIPRLDTMLGGEGYFRGASLMISGSAGAGKTTLAASFIVASCERGERAMLFAFEESPKQLARNLRSVGIDVESHVRAGLLEMNATRPAAQGLEAHLSVILHAVERFGPRLVVIDPISAFGGDPDGRQAMITRLIDWLKQREITAVFTSLDPAVTENTEFGVSSVIDAWLSLISVESNGERNRSLRVIKARGTAHSNQVRELVISSQGLDLLDVYTGSGSVVMGSARQIREAADAQEAVNREERAALRRRQIERQRLDIEARIGALRAELDAETETVEFELRTQARADAQRAVALDALRTIRHADERPMP